MSENTSINWYDDFLGVAYRYFDVRMNIALMFPERKKASNLWLETVNWWNDHTIKVRFVEIGDDYWFIVGADSRKPSTNKSFYKILPKSIINIIDGFFNKLLTSAFKIVPTLISTSINCLYSIIALNII